MLATEMHKIIFVFFSFLIVFFAGQAKGADCALKAELTGVIGPASMDWLERVEKAADAQQCSAIFLKVNTPGGSLETTRMIVEKILSSSRPVLCLVGPSGAHAGSAGAIILQACHVNGAMPATNLGAATPIASGSRVLSEDLRRKIINDTIGLLDGLTSLRGRSQTFGREIVTEAKAVSADVAKKLGAIDDVSESEMKFLEFAKTRKVQVGSIKDVDISFSSVIDMPLDARFHLLSLVADPEMAYILLMGSLALLYFEVTHPGVIAPGVVGGIGLVVSLVALHKLNVEWGGLALLLLGLALLIAEAFVPAFGSLGIGGIISFILGSVFLFNPESTGGYRLPWRLILPTTLFLGGLMVGLAFLVVGTRRLKRKSGFDEIVGKTGLVVSLAEASGHDGQIEILGEIWNFNSEDVLHLKSRVRVVGHKGLTLHVRKTERE